MIPRYGMPPEKGTIFCGQAGVRKVPPTRRALSRMQLHARRGWIVVWEGFGVGRTAFMGPGGSPIASIGQGPALAGPIPVQERTGPASALAEQPWMRRWFSIRAGRCKGVFMAHRGIRGREWVQQAG
jgi:hypothetical protein